MIFYLVTSAHKYTIHPYFLSSKGRLTPDLNGRVKVLTYEELKYHRFLPVGTYIFSDIERLSVAQTKEATRIYRKLESSGVQLLNDPLESMRRYELLRTLYEMGLNEFNVYRPTEYRKPAKYPLFLKSESNHSGCSDRLITCHEQFNLELKNFLFENSSREDTIIEEFCDTSDREGIFRKYSAFRIGKKIIPAHLYFGRKWMVKGRNLIHKTKVMENEEREYLLENPHEKKLRFIFDLAKIEYGRIDYSLKENKIQVWEINTNPCLYPLKKFKRSKEAVRMYSQINSALLEFDLHPSRTVILNPNWSSHKLKLLSRFKSIFGKAYKYIGKFIHGENAKRVLSQLIF